MLTTVYITAFCIALIALSVWSFTGGKSIIGRIAPFILALGLVTYIVALVLVPKIFLFKLMLVFRDMGFIAVCSMLVFFTRGNKILSAGIIIGIVIACVLWIIPVLRLSF